MPTALQVQAQREAKEDLLLVVRAELEDLWGTLDLSDARGVSKILQQVLPDLVTEYGDIAAALAADYYDELMSDYLVRTPSAVLAKAAPAGQTQAVARWGVGPLFGANPDTVAALAMLADATERLVLQPSRDTIAQNAKRDSIGYARIPSGKEPCAFCWMLASRGPVYGTARAAKFGDDGEKYHTKCYCEPTPMRGPQDYPQGYDPDALAKSFEDVYDGDLASSLSEFRKALSVR